MRFHRIIWILVFFVLPLYAQTGGDCFGWMITPSQVTLRLGDSQKFRVVGGDGRPVYGVEWALEQRGVVELDAGDEAEVRPVNTGSFVLTAALGKLELRATGTVVDVKEFAPGTILWNVDPLPGGTTSKIIQSVKVDEDTPDLYVQEDHPETSILRAVLADGREMWRRPAANSPCAIAQASSGRPVPRGRSVCIAIRTGMHKSAVRDVLRNAGIPDASFSSSQALWVIEQLGSECRVSFDAERKVSRAKKLLVN